MRIYVIRATENSDTTFGVFAKEDGTAFACSMELKWKNNAKNISRIPPGEYVIRRFVSPKFKIETFRIFGVPDRDYCLVHPANVVTELEGCIAIGNSFDYVAPKGKTADDGLGNSREEFEEFMKLMTGVNEATLIVIDPPVRP